MNFDKVCFVIMPLGSKEVRDDKGLPRTIDFDPIYQGIFEPAIRAAKLPEGGSLKPRRTDQDFFTGSISQDMFEYLEYSRMALADITGLNPNVLYELGVRHRAQESGTVIFRQPGVLVPFDINQVKAFPYEYEPTRQADLSRALVTRVLTESLARNRVDSPVKLALRAQRNDHSQIEPNLINAEDAIRLGDRPAAIAEYRTAVMKDPRNAYLHLRLGLLLKDLDRWAEALVQFEAAIVANAEYAEAYRERGIAQNKLFHNAGAPEGMPDGIESLETAIRLNPGDFNAYASLGGALRRQKRLAESLAAYERSTETSGGHSYPLLNAIKLKAMIRGRLDIDDGQRFMLRRAERSLRAQTSAATPFNAPWSLFDLAELRLYEGDKGEFLEMARKGTELASASYQIIAFRDGLQGLVDAGVTVDGLADAIEMLTLRASFLSADIQ